ncbi:hypothetical protein [Halovivax cerinus]|uniref:Rpa-associated protein n=1 Tax=Halovivax cerinus TaxID=1487865 RepID=A0ABD5NNV6_9EURY|nr:hypothetical protein [Halovivax cerinus]
MSSNGDGDSRPGREVAYRLFAAEFDDASLSYAESDEERAPNYVISPTGARLNRVFVVGTLTEVTDVNEEMVRARVVDPTGAFVVYAGQYQPEALAFLERADPPAFVAVSGKARTFEPDDGDQVYTSIRPETLSLVDAETRDRWVVDAAEHTIDRIRRYAAAVTLDVDGDALGDVLRENGVSEGFAEGIPLAMAHYRTTPTYLDGLRDVAVDAVRVVSGEQSQVEASVGSPDATGPDAPSYETLAADGPTFSVPDDVGTTEDEPESDAVTTDAPTGTSSDAAAGAAVGTATASEPVVDADADEAAVDVESTTEPSTGANDTTEPSTGDTDTAEPSAVDDDSDGEDVLGDFEPGDTTTADDGETANEDGTADAEPTADDEAVGDGVAADVDGAPDTDVPTDDDGTTDDGGSEPSAPNETESEPESDAVEPAPDAGDDGMYDLDEEERQAVEEEFGTDFTTGTEVDDPGEADIDVPDATDVASEVAESEPDQPSPDDDAGGRSETDDGPSDDGTDEAADATEDDAADEVDLQSQVVETMDDLDDGDGAERSAIVETVTEETGASEDDVEQAIQDALMGGECFEPSEDRLQAI